MPVSVIHKTNKNNLGSCSKYGFYLNKENIECISEGRWDELQPFFNQNRKQMTTMEAITLIDQNCKGKGLRKNQAKYFTLTLNFSQKELSFLAKKVAIRDIQSVREFNTKQYKEYNEYLSAYTKQAMNNYANNFNKNISQEQLVWFAKIEHHRRYKGTDKEVLNGIARSGEKKRGLQSHVHITVSRMHRDYRINLSPLTHARSSKNLTLNGRKIKGGFDRSNWKELNEHSFDLQFKYERQLNEKFETYRTLKLGSVEEKLELKALLQVEQNRQMQEQKNSQKSI